MKIKTQLVVTMILCCAMLLIVAAAVLVTNRRVEHLNAQAQIVHWIERDVSNLSYLTNDYLLFRESQQRTRWETKFSSFSANMSKLKPDDLEQQAIVDNIERSRQRLQAVFANVAATLADRSQSQDAAAIPAIIQVSWSRIAVQNQGIVFDAHRLEQLLRNQIDGLKRQRSIFIAALLVLFGAYFLANYLIVYRRTLKSISDLKAGTEIIGSGNLDHVVQVQHADEIGELTHAFNRMTANLEHVTASKTDLEKEMAERRKAEEEVRQQREWLHVTLSSIGDAVIATDTAGRITFINPIAAGLTGWAPEEALGRPIQSVVRTINEMTGEPGQDIVQCVLTEGCIVQTANHTTLVTRTGEQVPIEDSAALIKDGAGNLIGVVLVFRDVTEKRRAQAALSEAADRFRIVADFTYNWEYWRSPDNRFLYVSPSCERVTGYTREEFIQDPGLLTRSIHPDDRERISTHMHADLLHSEACELEFRILHRDGQERWISHTCQAVVNAQGRPMGRRSSNHDITERKRAESALRDGEARFRLLSETAGRLLATNDPRETVEDLCREVMAHLDCQTFFNFLVDEAAGRLHLNACAGIPEEEIRKIEWLDYGVAVCGCAARDGERIIAENIGSTGDPRTERIASYGIRAYACHPLIAHDRVIGTLSFGTRTRDRFQPEELALMKTVVDQVATAMDRRRILHELRRSRDILEMRVQERTVELEKRARQLSLLASELTLVEDRERRRLAGILHDNLQQLLVAAKMNIEILSGSVGTDQRPAVENILDLITQSIKVSRSLTDELSPPLLKHYGLAASLKWLGRWVQEMHGLKVDLSVDPLLDPKQMDHTVLLFQSVRELLFNVVKHSGVTTARVEMRKDADGGHRIVVSDQGVGLDSKIIWKHADVSAGFGLFSIRERMMLMGGRLEVESRPGMGASFSLVLPPEKIEAADEKSPETETNLEKPHAGQPPLSNIGDKIRVMLVDDHEVVRNGLSTLLGIIPDMEVVGESSDGEEAVRLVREILPDVILMDINMPKMNGLEATRLIHSEFPQIRIVILSMYEDPDDASAALSVGASAFLSKSGGTDKLLAAVRNKVE